MNYFHTTDTTDATIWKPGLSHVQDLDDFVVSWMIEDIGEYIDPNQFVSLKGSSTTFCLLNLVHNWLSEMDNPGCYIRACFLDFSKAFDRIDHIIVIKKLIDLGVRRSIVPWICSFLSERRQCVRLGRSVSKWLPVGAGVPQGTRLGPILFVIMIKRSETGISALLDKEVSGQITVWELVLARDTSIMQPELDTSTNPWTTQNNMVLNPKKCKEMIVRCRRQVERFSTSP